MLVRALCSGSSGNSMIIQVGQKAILVDAGGTKRKIVTGLNELGIGPNDLLGVILTHEHSDHIGSADAIARAYDAPIIANSPTLSASGLVDRGQSLATGTTLSFNLGSELGSLSLTSFRVNHDSIEPVGYLVESDGWTIGIATDLGDAPQSVIDALRQCDLVVLESNYDEEMLRSGPYPSYLKRRIFGPHGHLSNSQAAETALEITSHRPRWLWLAHLSQENNTPDLATRTVLGALVSARRNDVEVQTLDRLKPSPVFDTRNLFRQPHLF